MPDAAWNFDILPGDTRKRFLFFEKLSLPC